MIHVREVREDVPDSVEVGGRNPKRAFLLGLIPGVGALYNADYKKAAIHVGIFGIISVLENVTDSASFLRSPFHGFFQLLWYVFIFYMAFDAYHTAQKRSRRFKA